MIMRWVRRFRGTRAKLAALDKVQAIIEFTPDGRVVDANPLFLATLGYRLDEIVGADHRIFLHPEDAASSDYAAFWAGLRAGQSDTGLYRRLAKDGSTVWLRSSYNPLIDHRGAVVGVIKYATDVTAQRVAAADMDSRLTAIDGAQATIEFALDGTILSANANFLRAMGYVREDVIGHHHRMFLDASEASSPAYAAFWEGLRAGRHHAALYRRVGRGGQVVWIQATYNPLLDANGLPTRVIKYATDITAQTLAAQTLQREVLSLSRTVVRSAEKATQAEQLAVGARSSAEHGGELMTQVVTTMGRIQEGTRSIEEMVELIDDLSFQTNLLSLNAAIEAARAGEHGKAFAVVAGEVRHLAVRSAAAAQQIHRLIDDARAAVEEGVALVGTAGEAVHAIVSAITDVTDVTSVISDDATEQASGIQRVHSAVSQLNGIYGSH